jgi:hypothetical protein
MADLAHILQQLHDSEINAGMQTFYDTCIEGLGRRRGQRHQTTINRAGAFAAPPRNWPEGVTAASWLLEVTLRL